MFGITEKDLRNIIEKRNDLLQGRTVILDWLFCRRIYLKIDWLDNSEEILWEDSWIWQVDILDMECKEKRAKMRLQIQGCNSIVPSFFVLQYTF